MPALARRAWPTMGSWASLVTADPIDADTGRRLAAEAFESVEARLSSYRSDSEVSRFDRGEVPDPSAELRHVLAACEWLETASGGMFSSRPAGPAGPLDLAGYVKGWAIDQAADQLIAAGIERFALGIGGDWRILGGHPDDRPWRFAILDPADPASPRALVEVVEGALATSGRYERGDHVLVPPGAATGAAAAPTGAAGAASFSVVGPRLAWADAFATVGLLKGTGGIEWVAGFAGYAGAVVLADGAMYAADEFPLAADSAPRGAGAGDFPPQPSFTPSR